jgi:hypothetical protein
VRRQALTQPHRRPQTSSTDPVGEAGQRLLDVYAGLARRREHLLGGLLRGAPPLQWRHYPDDDARDAGGGYQWFYHSHSPEDRPGAAEHGHIHLFARRPVWARRLQSQAEQEFIRLCGQPAGDAETRHLLAIGFNAKGLPISLFTVNSWVTGDRMLNGPLSVALLAAMRLDTGHPDLDAVIESTIALHLDELPALMARRDAALAANRRQNRLQDRALEMLSELAVDLGDQAR